MSDESITLRLDSLKGDVDAEAFIDIFSETIAALQEINKAASEYGSVNLEWRIVDTGKNSPFFTKLWPFPAIQKDELGGLGERVVSAFISGLIALEISAAPPPLFSEDALRHVANIGRGRSHGVTTEYETPGRKVPVSQQVIQHASEAAKRLHLERMQRSGKYIEYGTVEGQLKGVESLSDKDKIVIADSLTKREIRCYFRDKSLEQKARDNWKRRVAVSGEIVVDKYTGDAIEVHADDIKPLRERDRLPQIDDLQGIDITGGMEASEYVRGLRDDD